MKPWSTKKKRIVIGLFMFESFWCLALTINFFAKFNNLLSMSLGIIIFWYFWVPPILLIILCYHVLTKVYKPEESKSITSIKGT